MQQEPALGVTSGHPSGVPFPQEISEVASGVWRVRFGTPEEATPVQLRTFEPLALVSGSDSSLPFGLANLVFRQSARGCVVEIPLGDDEQVYGFGLQLKSLNQTSKKRMIRVNSDPVADTGDSHAPVPFYVSTAGYGVLIDTYRYAVVNVGTGVKLGHGAQVTDGIELAGNTEDLYRARDLQGRQCVVEVPAATGIDVYFFAGPDLMAAVQRYNLFSGGGCLPPMWGLGVWYRGWTEHDAEGILDLAEGLRAQRLPCDVLGLEPGWQSRAYSCSFVWSDERFVDPDQFIARAKELGFHVNLWEHLFTHPEATRYEVLKPLSGTYEVWGGLVPDLASPEARKLVSDQHGSDFVDHGVSGFKLDECDNSDFISGAWSFPEVSQFPSGLDGEQMHSALGPLYMGTVLDAFRQRDLRTYSQVRAGHALSSPYPFVLYSDLYDHRDFVRGVATAGFSGLLWCPEVRDAASPEDLIRRIQSVVLSPQALVNAWYVKNPPWRQVEMALNLRDEFMPQEEEVTRIVREQFELRMRLLPYLYSAFAKYRTEGVPVCRALVMDYPEDAETYRIDDQWMLGPDLLVAPMFAGQTERSVYLPSGTWHCLHTAAPFEGGQRHTVAPGIEAIPVFVRDGAILPLAEPVQHVASDTVFEVHPQVWGDAPRACTLIEDDFETYAFERGVSNNVFLSWEAGAGHVEREGTYDGVRYRVSGWKRM